MPGKMREPSVRYYNWGDRASRVHDDGTGTETADFYQSDTGFVPMPAEMLSDAIPISREEYDELLRTEPERRERERVAALTDDSPIVETLYFRWDGDACRLHKHQNGRETADLYRGGLGLVPINSVEWEWGVPISFEQYQDLVEEEIEVRKNGSVYYPD
jgi:hypothetical protein